VPAAAGPAGEQAAPQGALRPEARREPAPASAGDPVPEPPPDPTPEEERRRRRETVYATAAYLLLFCCAAVAAALSFHGLVGFGRQNLRLSGGWEYLVPFGLDGAAMFCAVLAVREASHGDASLGSRLLVWTFAGAAAWFNWVHAPRGAGHAGAPQFFAGMSLSAAVLFDRALKQTRRAALREQGLVPRPLPQIRVVRWARAPRETYRAWSLMLLEGVRTLDEAVDEVREDRRRGAQDRQRRRERKKLERARVKALSKAPHARQWADAEEREPHAHADGRQPELPPERGQLREHGPDSDAAETASGAPVPGDGRPGSTPRQREHPPARRVRARPAADGAESSGTGGEPSAREWAEGASAPPYGAAAAAANSPRSPDTSAPAPPASATAATPEDSPGGSAAGPRLDSLEEKLAEIERQFG